MKRQAFTLDEKVNLCPVFKAISAQRYAEHPLHISNIPFDPQFGYRQNAYDDCFATFHSPPGSNLNDGTGNAAMLDGSVESVKPQNSGTFKKAWPKTSMVQNVWQLYPD